MSELTILGGTKTRTKPYPEWPVMGQRDIDAVTEVVKSGRWGGFPYPGPKPEELVGKFAEWQVSGYGVSMINETARVQEGSSDITHLSASTNPGIDTGKRPVISP